MVRFWLFLFHFFLQLLIRSWIFLGILCIFLQCFNYIIDTYLMFAASAIAANSLLRSFFGAGFPLFGDQMFHNLGIQWAGTLLGCLATVMIPIPVAFYFWGHKIRGWSKNSGLKEGEESEEQLHDSKEVDV